MRDLKQLSRSAQTAAIPVIDNIIRAVPNMTEHAGELRGNDGETLTEIVDAFDREAALNAAEAAIRRGEL